MTKPTAQIGFIKFVLIPMFETVAKVTIYNLFYSGIYAELGFFKTENAYRCNVKEFAGLLLLTLSIA